MVEDRKRRIVVHDKVIWGAEGICPSDFWKEKISIRKVVRNQNFEAVSPLTFLKKK